MHTKLRTFLAAGAVTALAPVTMLAAAAPASATVHEIVGQWCSGQDPLGPAGITGGSHADNFAKPLFASGVLMQVDYQDGTLITFDFDRPNVKVVSAGVIVPIGPGTYLELIQPDPDFPAFQQCPRLATG